MCEAAVVVVLLLPSWPSVPSSLPSELLDSAARLAALLAALLMVEGW